jgi:hypothetical protein
MSLSGDTPDEQQALVPHTYQGAVIQQRINDGYINATAMCKASGKLLADYTRLQTTKEFLAELSGSMGIPIDLLVRTVVTGPNELRGTWVHPQVAIHLAQWVSAKFAVQVSEWVFEWITGQTRNGDAWKQFQDRVSLVYDSVPTGYFCIFKEIADLFATMFHHGINPGTKMVLDISVGWQWGSHWAVNKFADKHGERMKFGHYYPQYFPQSASNPQDIWCYPEEALPEFRRWMRDVYIPHKMPPYLQDQVKQGKITPEAANNTKVALLDRERRRALPR